MKITTSIGTGTSKMLETARNLPGMIVQVPSAMVRGVQDGVFNFTSIFKQSRANVKNARRVTQEDLKAAKAQLAETKRQAAQLIRDEKAAVALTRKLGKQTVKDAADLVAGQEHELKLHAERRKAENLIESLKKEVTRITTLLNPKTSPVVAPTKDEKDAKDAEELVTGLPAAGTKSVLKDKSGDKLSKDAVSATSEAEDAPEESVGAGVAMKDDKTQDKDL